MSHDVLCTLQDSTVLVLSGYVVSGCAVSAPISYVGMSGTELGAETCQLPWYSTESLGVEYRYGELVRRRGAETLQLPWSPWSLMDGAVWILDILKEYDEKSEMWRIVTPAEFCCDYPWICGTSVFNE